MKFFLRTLYRKFRLFICYAAIVMVTMVCFITFYKSERNALTADKIEAGTKNSDKSYPFAKSYDRKDWHDWKFIEYEKLRVGPGEQGKEHILTDPEDIKLNEKVLEQNGLNGVVSDKISVNRSLPDTRPPKYEETFVSQYFFIKFLFQMRQHTVLQFSSEDVSDSNFSQRVFLSSLTDGSFSVQPNSS